MCSILSSPDMPGANLMALLPCRRRLCDPCEIYARLEETGYFYTIRLPSQLQCSKRRIAHRLTRPVGRPFADQGQSAIYLRTSGIQAQSWDKPRRVDAKIEWASGELCPQSRFIVTNMPMGPGLGGCALQPAMAPPSSTSRKGKYASADAASSGSVANQRGAAATARLGLQPGHLLAACVARGPWPGLGR